MSNTNRFAGILASIRGTTAAVAAPSVAAPAPNANDGGSDDATLTLTAAQTAAADAQIAQIEAAAEQRGATASNARWAAVLNSDAGKANMTGAIWALSNTTMSSDDIIAKLPEMGTPAASAEKTGGNRHVPNAGASDGGHLENTPTPKVSGASAANGEDSTDADLVSLWAEVQSESPLLSGSAGNLWADIQGKKAA